MAQALMKALSYLFIMVLGYGLKRVGFFGPEDHRILSKIVVNLTLPMSILVSFSSTTFDWSLLAMTGIAFAINCLLLGAGLALSRGKPKGDRALFALLLPGYNIGAFALPFTGAALGHQGAAATCLFDSGNAIMCTGGSYAVTDGVLSGTGSFRPLSLVKKLCSTVPFVAYMTMLALTVLGFRFPDWVVEFVSPIAGANTYCAMLMMGLMFSLDFPRETFRQVKALVLLRLCVGVVLAIACWFLLPLPRVLRKTLAVLVFAPPSILTPIFVEKCGGRASAASCATSLCTITAVLAFLTVLMLT